MEVINLSFSEFINACRLNENVDVTHVICVSKDNILAEYVEYPYQKDSLKLFFSMTKSFSSLAIGIAYDLGLLSIDSNIVDFFDEELPIKHDINLDKIKVKHLLTMSSGIHNNTYDDLIVKSNWVKAFLAQNFVHEPGTYYRYSTHGSHMLSAIITKVSGLSLEDFLNQYLFHPLKIYEAQWEQSPEGLTAGGMGLSLYPKSLAKIAQLLLNNGVYDGKHILSQNYIKMAISRQIVKQDDIKDSNTIFKGVEYGFQFHIGKENFYRFDGAFGQLCLLCPELDVAIIVFSNYAKMEILLSLIYKHILNDVKNIDSITQEYDLNEHRKKNLFEVPCNKYKMQINPLGIDYIEFFKVYDGYEIKFTNKSGIDTLKFSFFEQSNGKMNFIKDLQTHFQQYVCVANVTNFIELKVYFIETPYIATYSFSFDESNVTFNFEINVSFTLKEFSTKGIVC